MADPTPYSPLRNTDPERFARSAFPRVVGMTASPPAPMTDAEGRMFGKDLRGAPQPPQWTPRGVEVTELDIDPRRPGSVPDTGRMRGPQVGAYQADHLANMGPQRPAGAAAAPTALQQPASYRAGRAVGETLRGAGGGAGRAGGVAGVLAGTAMGSVADSMTTPTENYRRRLGMQTDDPSLGGDLLARGVGVVSDLGASILDTPVALANGVSRMFGGEGSLRLPGGNFGEILRRNDSPADAQVYADAAPALRPTSTAATSAMPAPRVASAAQTAAPAIQSGGDTPDTLALRTRQRDAQTQADIVEGQRMEAARRAAEAENVAGNAQALRVAQSQTARMEAERARRDADTQASSIQQQTALRGLQKLKEIDQRDLQGVRNQGAMDVAGLQAETLRRGQDLTADTTRRGQDLELEGRQLDSAAKRAQLRYQMGKDERDFAAQRGDAAFTQREAAKKRIDGEIDARYTDPKTGKVDATKATMHKQFLQNGIADEAARLAQTNPQLAARLSKMSYADLDPEDMQALEQAWQVRAAAQAGDGWLPGSGHFVDSLRPSDFQPTGVSQRTFSSDQVTLRNGSRVAKNDLTGNAWYSPRGATNSVFDKTLSAAEEAALRNQGR